MGKISYMCSDPLCTSISPKQLLKGKLSLCPKCKTNEFILTPRHLERANPVCVLCTNGISAKQYQETRKKLAEVLGLGLDERE